MGFFNDLKDKVQDKIKDTFVERAFDMAKDTVLNKVFKRQEKLLEKINQGKGKAADGIILANDYIKRGNTLLTNVKALQLESAIKYSNINIKFSDDKDVSSNDDMGHLLSGVAEKLPVYDKISQGYYNINIACTPIIENTVRIKKELEIQKENLSSVAADLAEAESNLNELDLKNTEKQQEHQTAMDKIEGIILEKTAKIKVYDNKVKQLGEIITKGEEAATKLIEINETIKGLETKLLNAAKDTSSEAEEERNKDNENLNLVRKERAQFEADNDAGLRATTELEKYVEAKSVLIEKVRDELNQVNEKKEELVKAAEKRELEYSSKKTELEKPKTEAEEKIQIALAEVAKLKAELEAKEAEFKTQKGNMKTTTKEEKTSKELTAEEKAANSTQVI